jgi:hypothetical protein
VTTSVFNLTASAHDAYQAEDGGNADLAGTTVLAQNHTSDAAQRRSIGWWFENVGTTVPADATIVDTYLGLRTDKSGNTSNIDGDIKAQVAATPAVWSATDGPVDRLAAATFTTETVAWVQAVADATNVDSPSFPKVFAEVISTATGWGTGSDFATVLEMGDTNNSNIAQFEAYDGAGTDEGELTVTWYLAGGIAPAVVTGIAGTAKASTIASRAPAIAAGTAAASKSAGVAGTAPAIVAGIVSTSRSSTIAGRAPAIAAGIAASSKGAGADGRAPAIVAGIVSTSRSSTIAGMAPAIATSRSTSTTTKTTAVRAPAIVIGIASTTTTKPTTGRAAAVIAARAFATQGLAAVAATARGAHGPLVVTAGAHAPVAATSGATN